MNDGVNPKFWGRFLWRSQEIEIESLPDVPRNDPRRALQAKLKALKQLGLFMPCLKCRRHYVENGKKVCAWMARRGMPMNHTVTRARLHFYWWKVHDTVNESTGKGEDHRRRYNWEWYKTKYPGARGPLTNAELAHGGITAGPGDTNALLCDGMRCPPAANQTPTVGSFPEQLRSL